MSPTITLKGAIKFSVRKLVAGGEMATSTYLGPGEVLLAPATLGDVTLLRLTGTSGAAEQWSVGKDAFLACTQGIVREYKSQGIGKAIFSGEGLFVYRMSGAGIVWITSFGAIIRKDVSLVLVRGLCGCGCVCSLTRCVAAGWRAVCCRQWAFGGVELQLRYGEGGERWYHFWVVVWGGLDLQVQW